MCTSNGICAAVKARLCSEELGIYYKLGGADERGERREGMGEGEMCSSRNSFKSPDEV